MSDRGKIMGIDYGDVRIGIAVSDVDQIVAFGRTSIQNTSQNDAIKKIKEICDEEKIVEIVVGLPLSMEGKHTEQTDKTKVFGEKLKEVTNLIVNYQDERLTTMESDAILYTLGVRGKGKSKIATKKKEKDKIAASLILQNYLNLVTRENREAGETLSHNNK
jgi:putative Holliday junction resolvase